MRAWSESWPQSSLQRAHPRMHPRGGRSEEGNPFFLLLFGPPCPPSVHPRLSPHSGGGPLPTPESGWMEPPQAWLLRPLFCRRCPEPPAPRSRGQSRVWVLFVPGRWASASQAGPSPDRRHHDPPWPRPTPPPPIFLHGSPTLSSLLPAPSSGLSGDEPYGPDMNKVPRAQPSPHCL